ncbi:conjugal transfer protein [Furfurilactobacillus milii]|uniref:Conjugal transfer protein n=1 Tax=Furfurilactobacillus milii TaxID=2888272 RepID=A0A6N9HZB8_9LACO|nr:conjugal transfer protein [Furfurilactobacillus milii]MYV16055.1 conjugal transfer protein [Furfurilactobacillus milii]
MFKKHKPVAKTSETKEVKPPQPRLRFKRIGLRKKTVVLCWSVLILGTSFGVYKSFTAIDTHTVHEHEVVRTVVVDTHAVTTFVSDFAKVYFSWEPSHEALDQRQANLKDYLTNSLQTLDADTVRSDIPSTSSIDQVKIWRVKQLAKQQFEVLFAINQTLKVDHDKGPKDDKKDDKDKKSEPSIKHVQSTYSVNVQESNQGNLVITKNPTIAAAPSKANIKETQSQTDNSVNPDTVADATKFLKTFFALYPQGSQNELKYYVADQNIQPLHKDYKLDDLVNPIFHKEKQGLRVSVTVKYLDNETNMTQLSQFELHLIKENNRWNIQSGI